MTDVKRQERLWEGVLMRAARAAAASLKAAGAANQASFADVHAHLTHARFAGEQEAILERARVAGVDRIVANGVNPRDNRAVLALSARHPQVLAALGIHPLDACAGVAAADPAASWVGDAAAVPAAVDVGTEVAFIDEMAAAGRIVALGECGLDAHHVARASPAMKRQEEVPNGVVGAAQRRDRPECSGKLSCTDKLQVEQGTSRRISQCVRISIFSE